MSHNQFVILSNKHAELIYGLLRDHYIDDLDCGLRTFYSLESVKWIIHKSYITLGLVCDKTLVGCITALVIKSRIKGDDHDVAYLNCWCVQKRLRGNGLGRQLYEEIRKRLSVKGIDKLCYSLPCLLADRTPSLILKTYVVPINLTKLKIIGFIPDYLPQQSRLSDNPLHMANESDLNQIGNKLVDAYNHCSLTPCWMNSSHLIPYKKTNYTFVIRNILGDVTDLVSVRLSYQTNHNQSWIITNATLILYYHSTLGLTQLVELLIDKLQGYNIDQLIIDSSMDNIDINVSKYELGIQYCYLEGIEPLVKHSSSYCIPFCL